MTECSKEGTNDGLKVPTFTIYTATYRETWTAAVYNSKWRIDQH